MKIFSSFKWGYLILSSTFSWEKIGLRDLPTIIDSIISKTGHKKLSYVGYNQGNTAFYVLASKQPVYNSKIRKMIAIGPMVYLKHSRHYLLSEIRSHRKSFKVSAPLFYSFMNNITSSSILGDCIFHSTSLKLIDCRLILPQIIYHVICSNKLRTND